VETESLRELIDGRLSVPRTYFGEDSGSQAIAGEFSRILEQFWSNPKIVSQWLFKPLLHSQMELEARVGIEQVYWFFSKLITRQLPPHHQRRTAS
jgi:hypothetical protein